MAELVLGGSEALVDGAAIPYEGLRVVLRDTAAAEIEIGECELGLGIAGGGLLLKGVKIVGLQWCGRGGFLGLCARRGGQREGKEG